MELYCFEIVVVIGVYIVGLCCGKFFFYFCFCFVSVLVSCNWEGDLVMYVSFELIVRIVCYVRYVIDVLNYVLDG